MSGVFDHPWLGGLFADDAAGVIWSPERQLAHMLSFEAAYSRALGAVGVVETAKADKAAKLIAGFDVDIANLRVGTARDGLPVPALVAQLRAGAAPDLSDAIHKGTTSQDVMDTALALTIKDMNALLSTRLKALDGGLGRLIETFGTQPLMGRTRMQAAMPITVADRIATWQTPLHDHLARLAQMRPRVERLQLGGAAGDRQEMAGKGADMARMIADDLGLYCPDRPWHAMRDGLADYGGLLSLITGTLGKMGQDIALMAQQGVGEITLAGGGGSSAMPHKQNPILAELLVTLARFNATQVAGLHHTMVHEQERSGAAWALEWMILPQMALATARSLAVALTVCDQITAMGGPSQ
ncbi:MAG: 3-carboxy-cis,cis-muconate cycloisomerase [Roseovarius sp.]|nr:3-carboxy-cis,cis-muconate cycloisomerase [Roseovarius sp.]